MKKNIAIIWGGYTSEIVVSEKSMQGVYTFIDKLKYNVYKIRIDKKSWTVDLDNRIYEVDKNDFSFVIDKQKVTIDFAYITIHGTPGEDGKLQGYLDMIGIPYSSCGVVTSALTMNKFMCNKYLSNFGVVTAQSTLLRAGESYNCKQIAEDIKFPMFVKPNSGGSSFATSKVKTIDDLQKAIDLAFEEANEVIIESLITGTEVTCGCYKTDKKAVVFPLTEVVTNNEFFDYDAKYNGQVEEITPARISEDLTKLIQDQTSKIYDLIGANGIIRADYIIHQETPFLLEVNTTPGMTLTSFIPQQIKAAQLNIVEVFSEIIEYQYNKHK